jgi:chemotaxis protein methyltransferase CheR
MGARSQNLSLPTGTDALIRNLIHERTGVFFDNGKSELLIDKLSPLVIERGFSSYLDYYYLLKYDEADRTEWQNVMNAVSVQETYFWREIDQIKALVQTVLPEFERTHNGAKLRIWSAACATGEEPLTIAMALNEAGWFDRMSIEILATDASSNAIQRARAGVFRERAFRNLPPELRQRYFTRDHETEGWRIASAMHEKVSWAIANLVDEDQIADFASANVIFCRNVFIYFSDSAISQVVRSFAKFLRPPGYLFVGAAESLVRLAANFSLTEIDDAFVYVKQDGR